MIRPQNQDPQQSGSKRTYYSELVAVAPSSGQTPSLELNTSEGITAATQALPVTFKPGCSQTTTRRTCAYDDYFEWIGTVRQIVIDRAITLQQLDNVKAAVQSLNYLLFADFDNSANNAQYSDFGIAYAPDPDGNVPEQQLSPVGLAFQRFALTQIWVIE